MCRQHQVRLLSVLLVAALLLVVVGGGLALAQGTPPIPPLPQSFWGSVKDADGNPIPSGTVEARLNGVKQDSIAIVNGQYGTPEGQWGDRLAVQGTADDIGKTIEFYVNGIKARETANYNPGQITRLDLTVAGPPPDTTPPTVASTDPANGATNVPVNKTITVTFSEDVQEGSAYSGIAVKDLAGIAVDVTKSIAGKVLSIKPNANLAYSTTYAVYILDGAVKDLAGNPLAQAYTFSFATQSKPAPSPSGDGGGGAPPSTADKVEQPIRPGQTTVAELPNKVKVEVPPGAVTGTNPKITAEVVSDAKAAGAGMPLLSKVVDVNLKDGTLTGFIAIILYFDKNKLGSGQEPVVHYYDETQKKWVPLEGTVDLDKGTVTAKVSHLTLFAVFAVAKEMPKPPVRPTFLDMAGHWAEETVSELAYRGIISGYPDGTFRPDRTLTRAEIAALLVRALKLTSGDEQELKFKDNAAIPAWARSAVAAAVREGLIKGYPQRDGTVTFEAGRSLSRTEMACLVARVLEKKLGAITPAKLTFTDAAKTPAWARSSIGIAVAKGVISGYPDRTFRGERLVTRAEAASMILRLLEALGEK